MKTQKILSLDVEIVEKLRNEKNGSQLVNDLLIKHYKSQEPETLEEKKKRLALLKLKAKHEKEIQAVAT